MAPRPKKPKSFADCVYDFMRNHLKKPIKESEGHKQFFEAFHDESCQVVFLTGGPGTGKSVAVNALKRYMIHNIAKKLESKAKESPDQVFVKLPPKSALRTAKTEQELLEKVKADKAKNTPKKRTPFSKYVKEAEKIFVTTASTGMACLNLGDARTLHSFLGVSDPAYIASLKLGDLSFTTRENLAHVKVLIVDEISLLHPNIVNNLDQLLRTVHGSLLPFGGIKIIFVGDFFQLLPVYGKKDPIKSSIRKVVDRVLAFETKSWIEAHVRVILLTENFRQAGDQAFVSLLGRVARNELTKADEATLEQRQFASVADFMASNQTDVHPTVLLPTNDAVDAYNLERLRKLLYYPEYTYISNFICSRRRISDINAMIQEADKSKLYDVFNNNFKCLPIPCNVAFSNGVPLERQGDNNDHQPVSSYGTQYQPFYYDYGMMGYESMGVKCQKLKANRANHVLKLRKGALVSLTKTISLPHKLANQSQGVVKCFMSLYDFCMLKGVKKIAKGFYGTTIKNWDLNRHVDAPDDEAEEVDNDDESIDEDEIFLEDDEEEDDDEFFTTNKTQEKSSPTRTMPSTTTTKRFHHTTEPGLEEDALSQYQIDIYDDENELMPDVGFIDKLSCQPIRRTFNHDRFPVVAFEGGYVILMTPTLMQLQYINYQEMHKIEERARELMKTTDSDSPLPKNKNDIANRALDAISQATQDYHKKQQKKFTYFSSNAGGKRDNYEDYKKYQQPLQLLVWGVDLALRYGNTYHSAQGLTHDSVYIFKDFKMDYGMFNTIISRVRSLKNFGMESFSTCMLKTHPRVLSYYSETKEKSEGKVVNENVEEAASLLARGEAF